MKHDRDGVEVLALRQSTSPESRCLPTWVPGDLNLADALTKDGPEARRSLSFAMLKRSWVLKFDPDFISAKKRHKLNAKKAEPDSEVNSNYLDITNQYLAEWSRIQQ
eukprot:12079224-Alexandrium_andersonii.AAC.1